MTQGDPLAISSYGIVVIPLMKDPKVANPDVTQPWHTDDSVALGTFDNIGLCFN